MGNSSSTSKDKVNYNVIVKTSDRKNAGTDGNIFIAFYNKEGKRSRNHKLDVRFRDDFQAGHNDTFPIKNLSEFGEIVKIELCRDRWLFWDDWLVEWIIVTDKVNSLFYEFPINRWIKGGTRTRWSRYDTSLPQYDSEHKQRKHELIEKRQIYKFWQKIPGLPVQSKDLPKDEKFQTGIIKSFTSSARKLRLNADLILLTAKSFSTLRDIELIYRYSFEPPSLIQTWDSDTVFANHVLNGCNPTQIRLCQEIPAGFLVTSKMVEPFIEDVTLDQAMDSKRLFIIDYNVMVGINQMPCPFALFYVANDKQLKPIAIQLMRYPDDSTKQPPVFLPSDPPYTWKIAKMWFSLADASYHQASIYCFTYNILECIAVTTHRHLSLSHPLHRMIIPHIQHVIATNSQVVNKVTEVGGTFDKLFKMGRKGAFEISRNDSKLRNVKLTEVFPNNLRERGVDNENVLPNYHYRDDGLLIWSAITNYVSAIVNSYYETDDMVENDFELHSWRSTLCKSVDGGGCDIPGIPGNNGFENRDQVIETFTLIIFIASAGYASSHFSMYEQYAYPPAYPGFLKGEPISDKNERTEADLIAILPDKHKAVDMLVVTKLPSIKKNKSTLGAFESQWLFSTECSNALQNFKRELHKAAISIDERNKRRTFPYYSLHPTNVPNGITI